MTAEEARGVILDVDGTLVDSNEAHARAWHDTFVEAGLDAPPVERLVRLIGMGSDKLLPAAIGVRADSETGKRLTERRAAIFGDRYLRGLRPTPGAKRLVTTLRDRGQRLAVASSAKPDELRSLLGVAGVPWLADEATSADDVAGSKPDPDVIHAALGRLQLPPEAVVVIGDTPYDVEAADRAKVATIAVRSGGWDAPELGDAIAVFDDPADILDHLADTPLGERAEEAGRPA